MQVDNTVKSPSMQHSDQLLSGPARVFRRRRRGVPRRLVLDKFEQMLEQ